MENQILSNNQQGSKVYKNPKKGSMAFIGAFVFFFFPFFLVECSQSSKNNREINGVELATGGVMNTIVKSSKGFYGYMEAPTSMWASFAFLCVLVGIPAAILYNKKAAVISYWAGVIGSVSLVILPIHLMYFKYSEEINMDFVHFRFGYFVTLGFLIAAAYFCYKRYNEVFNRNNDDKAKRNYHEF